MNKILFGQLNISFQCKKYSLPILQCPQFLFLIMGVFIMIASVVSYMVGTRMITDPMIVALIDLIITGFLLVMSFIVVRSFERIAEASRMKSEFINIVSHQLRSPLTNIKWITDFLLSENVNPTLEKKKEYFNHMQENVSRMGELVDELLIVSRIEQGSFPVNKKESSIVNLLKEAVSRSSVSAEASKIGVNVSIEENLPVFFFDPSLLKLVMENLFDNSIRYTQPGGRVKIRMEKKGNNIYFEIKDSGVGIPKEEQKFIFQKFFRAENPLKEKTKGSGLGLYIAKKIIERLNGKIWFDSVCGVGTTFYFTLPIK